MDNDFVKNYWESRYKAGGDSGLGSHDPESVKFKSDYINRLITINNFKTIVELGCGDGNELQKLVSYEKYTGYDISETIIGVCSNKFKSDKSKEFVTDINEIKKNKYDLALSLDVIYHLVEDSVFKEHMDTLFSVSKNVCLYTTNSGSLASAVPHIKHRDVEEFVKENYPKFELVDKKPFTKYNVMFLLFNEK